jgi:hypothetical protein
MVRPQTISSVTRKPLRAGTVSVHTCCSSRTTDQHLYRPARDGKLLYDHLGYDPEYTALFPGTALQLLVLEALFAARSFKIFDFTEGKSQLKELFSTDR